VHTVLYIGSIILYGFREGKMESDRAENQPVPAEEDTRDGGVLRSSSSKLLATIRNCRQVDSLWDAEQKLVRFYFSRPQIALTIA
jgi:hypothetical protein